MRQKILFIFLLLMSAYFIGSAQPDTILHRYRQYLFQTIHPVHIQQLLSSLKPDGYWANIDYNSDTRNGWQAIHHLQRVQEMAVAWSNPDAEYFHQKNLEAAIDHAIDYWLYHRFYNQNWWWNEIGVPQYMRNILVLMQHHLSSYQHIRALEELDQYRINGTGSNLIWSAELGFFYGAFTNDTVWMRHCMDTLLHEIRINTGEGIQPDYSFHMHGNRLQIYSYGKAYLTEAVKLAALCKGTTWAFPEDKIKLLTGFVLNGWQWMCRGINIPPGTIDRAISDENALHAADIRDLIPALISLSPEETEALKAFAGRQNGTGYPLTGFRYYPYSDFAVYQNKNYSFFLKTISTRTLPSESINGDNLKGHLLNSGDACLIHDGNEYFNLMPVWKWNKLPGITSFNNAEKIVRKPFVGSVSDNSSGLTAMDYWMQGRDTIQSIQAHKIWACHNGLIVCLIAGLTSDNVPGNVYTVLDQCRLHGRITVNNMSNPVQYGDHLMKDIHWIQQNQFTYFLLKPSTIRLYADTAGGTWESVSASEPDSLITDSVFMPVIIHGKTPVNVSSGYVLAYCLSPTQAAQWYAKPAWEILRNDTLCQAVQFNDGTVMAAFFHQDMLKIGHFSIKVNRPCLVLLSNDKGYISDPIHEGGKVTVLINRKSKVITLPDNGTTVTFAW